MTEPSLPEETIFAQALELDSADERAAFLERACGGDRTLRAGVEALLRADERSGDLLDLPERPSARLNGLGAERPGAAVGPYTLLREIGEGGMGTVWMAEQSHPVRRKAALKLVKPGMDSRRVIARFEAERQALALMDHPNIAKVLDAGTTACGRPYFVMELVEGVPITEYCDDHGLVPRERLELFLSVCHAVQHAHQKGIIHRDLKPSNVLVATYDGEPVPKIIDFGVSKATGQTPTERTTFTQHGQLIGTLEYMSPEQASFNTPDIDTRSDIYSLGVLLYELLTGSTPFEKGRLRELAFDETLRVIREEEPPRPSARLSGLGRSGATSRDGAPTGPAPDLGLREPGSSLASIAARRRTNPVVLARMIRGDLDWIVMKALEKDRDRRYETADGLAMDLQRYLADEPVAAFPPSVRYRMRKFVRRNKGPVLAASMLVLTLVVGIIGTTRGERNATNQLFLALLNQARAGRFSRQMGQRLDSLEALTRAARIRPDERLRDEATAAMALPDIRLVPASRPSPPGTVAVAFAERRGLYARADARGFISLRGIADDREVRRIASGPVADHYLYFSPDERFLLGLGEGPTIRVWRVADGQPALPDEPRGSRVYAFSPDGRRLAVGRREQVLVFDLATGREVTRWRLPKPAHSLAFHPRDDRLAVGHSTSKVAAVYDAANGVLLAGLPVGATDAQVVAWHPDGQRLAVAGSDPRIQVWDVAARRKLTSLEGHVQNVTDLTFHPRGDLLASRGWDGMLMLWHPSSGRLLMRLTFVTDSLLRFSADGRRLEITSWGERADRLEVTPCREYLTLGGSAGPGPVGYCQADISPDGRLLAVAMDAGTRLWDLRDGREVVALPAGTSYVSFEGLETGEGGRRPPGSPRWRLLTSGGAGLLRWPVSSDDPEGRHLRLGPPQRLSPLQRAWFARRPDGRTLVAATEEGGTNQILDLETGAVRRELEAHPLGEVRALSGDGRWAASCGWHSDRVRLWEVDTGRMVSEWVQGTRTRVAFTPDSRALIIGWADGFGFWDVETLRPIRRLRRDAAQFPGGVAFSPDGRLMALEMAPAVIHLKEVATARTVARLEDPHGDRATWQGFTPDGTRLVVVAAYANAIHIWDLRTIRAGLKGMGLDWDWPEFPPDRDEHKVLEPVTIEVVPARRAGFALTREQQAKRAIERFRREWEANPDSAKACNSLAWAYVTAPEALRELTAALPLAEKAVRLAPGDTSFRNTLGVAYYRAGRYREAAELLRPNLENQSDEMLAYDLFVLAMSFHRQGETARARDSYDCAVRWTRVWEQRFAEKETDELAAFRTEAAELLGIDRKNDSSPEAGRHAERPDPSGR
jgi:serine/threonine protein kinase/WD40 repeat protein